MNHKANVLHENVGKIFKDTFEKREGWELIVDKACGGNQRIPLFFNKKKSRESEYCNVDLAVLNKNRVKIIVEIEESNVKATQVCGKFLTSALARYYVHESKNNEPIPMADSVTFIQIVDTAKIVREKSRKSKQWKALEESIRNIIPLKDSGIVEYKLFTTDELDELISYVRGIG